jgi:hypothetical protein
MGRGTIWNKERIEPQLSNVLADWVWGKWEWRVKRITVSSGRIAGGEEVEMIPSS